MAELIDIISPLTVGSDQIVITVDPVSEPLLVGNAITLNFDYSAVAPGGVVLPLIFKVQPLFGRGVGYSEQVFRRHRLNSYSFTVPGAGRYLALLRECYHNHWQGRILLDVGGEEFSQIQSTRQEV